MANSCRATGSSSRSTTSSLKKPLTSKSRCFWRGCTEPAAKLKRPMLSRGPERHWGFASSQTGRVGFFSVALDFGRGSAASIRQDRDERRLVDLLGEVQRRALGEPLQRLETKL